MILEKVETTVIDEGVVTVDNITIFNPGGDCIEITSDSTDWTFLGDPDIERSTAESVATICSGAPTLTSTDFVNFSVFNILTQFSSGWNSWAVSIDHLPEGSKVSFTIGSDTSTLFIGLGLKNKEAIGVSQFDHGILLTSSGVDAFEGGVSQSRIIDSFDETTVFSILRGRDGVMTYIVGDKSYVSNTLALPVIDLYLYGYLYSAVDTVVDPELNEGEVRQGSVEFDPELEMTIANCDVYFNPELTMETRGPNKCITSASLDMYVFVDPYAIGGTPGLDQETQLFSIGLLSSGIYSNRNVIVVLNSSGQVISTITDTRLKIAELLSSMLGSSSFSVLGEYSATLLSVLAGQSMAMGKIGSGASLNDDSRVWVVNMDTGASSQYEGYGFTDFFERGGEYFGIAEDGIYLLEGDTDSGVDIDALIDMGLSNYGTRKIKKPLGLFVGCSSTGVLLLKAVADGVEQIYTMNDYSATHKVHKVPTNHRHLGSEWNLVLLNKDGCDFDISEVDFRILPTTRRNQ